MNNNYRKIPIKNREHIKNVVIYTILSYSISIPIKGSEVANKLKIPTTSYSSLNAKKLAYALKMSDYGLYCEFDGKKCIFYNDIDKRYIQQNETILHEIGHSLLGHRGLEKYNEFEESEATYFAKYAIVMPILFKRNFSKYLEMLFISLTLVMKGLYMIFMDLSNCTNNLNDCFGNKKNA